ncbi:MAG TPA: lipocalin family protein [Pyrinomonadaceae bacterium]
MKQLLLLTVCFLSFVVGSAAQISDTFDIATFQPPAEWKKQTKEGVVIFSTLNEQKGTYAMITLYGSGESSGNAKDDFDSEWQQFVVGQLGIKGRPEIEPVQNIQGWAVISGGTTFQNEQGTSAIILRTYSGYGKTFSATAIFNSQDNLPAIEAFAASIKLRKPETRPQAAPANNESAVSIVGTWGKSAGAHMSYGDPVAAGMAGYSKDQYTFNADGTYTFVSKTFRMSFDKLLLVRENGSYQINGDTITISPKRSVIQAWSKRDGGDSWGRLLTTQNRALEAVTYRFTKHYFSGIQVWNLVLQADRPTQRDGPFSNNTSFTNAWYYAPISPNNPVIELPR